jgi:hypothetical protein
MPSLANVFIGLLGLFYALSPVFAAVVPAFPYGSRKVRGVNLGGWLLLEVGSRFVLAGLLFHLSTS